MQKLFQKKKKILSLGLWIVKYNTRLPTRKTKNPIQFFSKKRKKEKKKNPIQFCSTIAKQLSSYYFILFFRNNFRP